MNLLKIIQSFGDNYDAFILLVYLVSLKETPASLTYQDIKSKTNLSKYIQKKSLKYLNKEGIINYHKTGHSNDLKIVIDINMGHKIVKHLKEVTKW